MLFSSLLPITEIHVKLCSTENRFRLHFIPISSNKLRASIAYILPRSSYKLFLEKSTFRIIVTKSDCTSYVETNIIIL